MAQYFLAMILNIARMVIAVFLLLACMSVTTAANGGTTADVPLLERELDSVLLFRGIEFQEFCHQAEIPCGMEGPTPAQRTNGSDLEIHGKSVRQVLNILIRGRLKGYAWRLSDGVLELAPKGVFEKRTHSPLDRLLPSIDIDELPLDQAAARICELAKVAKPSGKFSILGREPLPNVSLHLKNTTARQALNALVRQHGKALWHVYPLEKGRGIVVESYDTRNVRVPDSAEPIQRKRAGQDD